MVLRELVILGLVGTKDDAVLLCHPMANSGIEDNEPFDSSLGFALAKLTADEVFADWRPQLLNRFFPWETGRRATFPAIISYSEDPMAIRSIVPLGDSTLDKMIKFTGRDINKFLEALEEFIEVATETETRLCKLFEGDK